NGISSLNGDTLVADEEAFKDYGNDFTIIIKNYTESTGIEVAMESTAKIDSGADGIPAQIQEIKNTASKYDPDTKIADSVSFRIYVNSVFPQTTTLKMTISEYNVYTVSFSGPSVSNATAEAGSGDAYSTTLTPKEGYNIPSSVSITVGGVAIDSNSYTYTPSTGALTINKEAITGDIVITAVSTLMQYTITYNLGDNVTNLNPTTYTIQDTITLQAPIKDGGYIFGGWTGSNGATPQTSVTIPQGSTGNKTYTVSSWTLGDYTLMQGQDLNAKIKQTANNNTTANSSTTDTTIKTIIFGKYSDYSSNVAEIGWANGIAVDGDGAGYIRMFLTNSNANCYILSDGNIYANAELTESDNYNRMFYAFQGVTSITFNNFNTANVTKMDYMFYSCPSLTSLDVSNFNTSKVTTMLYMFYGCSSLTSLDLSSFNTSNVTNMNYMFYSCPSLTSLDVSNFNTSNVTNMSYMFYDCRGLTSLNLSSFNTSNVTTMNYMFQKCSGLTKIYVGNSWSTANLKSITGSTGMFSGCTSLVGGNGTVFDSTKTNKTYARIDTAETPGYLTLKT
ncbi:MAG: BspA family leucine-rich repeat surface protein, partial [Clostridia bacterium]|nr:BspA family leucine-rich repeat surface protein [Clostridia bacterium]